MARIKGDDQEPADVALLQIGPRLSNRNEFAVAA
jgi:hypothetical protein